MKASSVELTDGTQLYAGFGDVGVSGIETCTEGAIVQYGDPMRSVLFPWHRISKVHLPDITLRS